MYKCWSHKSFVWGRADALSSGVCHGFVLPRLGAFPIRVRLVFSVTQSNLRARAILARLDEVVAPAACNDTVQPLSV
jgi:hypothetical protein